MKFKSTVWMLAALVGATLVSESASAQGRQRYGEYWDKLGCVEISWRSERETIRVPRQDVRFKAIRVEAERRDVFIQDLTVVYGDGQPDRLAVNASVRQGQPSRALDLLGWGRAIDRIEVVARKAPTEDRGRGELCIFGLEASRDDLERHRGHDWERGRTAAVAGGNFGRREDWKELGCERAGFVNDRDIVRVTRREDRFRAIRLGVQDNDVRISDIRVVYGNGEEEHVGIDQEVDRGSFTRLLPLSGGRPRRIDRIEMVYHSRPSVRGQGRVCVYGLE